MDVIVFAGLADSVTDKRRTIDEVILGREFEIPFAVKQIKIIRLTKEAVDQGLAVGNHYHTIESGREELFIVWGGKSAKKHAPIFKFKYREFGREEIQDVELMSGDACYVPPGWSHSFLPLKAGLEIWGFSNMEYDSKHDLPDKLF